MHVHVKCQGNRRDRTYVRLGIEKNAHQSPITFMNVRIDYKEQWSGEGVHAILSSNLNKMSPLFNAPLVCRCFLFNQFQIYFYIPRT